MAYKEELSMDPSLAVSRDDSSTRSWQGIADDWVAHADTNDYRNLFLIPLTFQMLGDVRSKTVLDLGCGEGGYSRELTRLRAQVLGVDGSARLVDIARERALAEDLDVRYLCLNANALGWDRLWVVQFGLGVNEPHGR